MQRFSSRDGHWPLAVGVGTLVLGIDTRGQDIQHLPTLRELSTSTEGAEVTGPFLRFSVSNRYLRHPRLRVHFSSEAAPQTDEHAAPPR